MGLHVAKFRFSGTPPSREEVNDRLRLEGGELCTLSGSRREGSDLVIYTSISAYAPAYASKVLRGMGGIEIDYDTGEPVDEPLPEFVDKPWLEHDEVTRQRILNAFQDEVDSWDPAKRK